MSARIFFCVLAVVACSAEKNGAPAPAPAPAPPVAGGPAHRVELSVTKNGFEPTPVKVKRGEPLELVVTRKTDSTCAKEIVVPAANVKKALPLNEAVVIAFTPDKAGELRYGCGMGQMVSGVLLVE